mgnify:CR=1 FL=1
MEIIVPKIVDGQTIIHNQEIKVIIYFIILMVICFV